MGVNISSETRAVDAPPLKPITIPTRLAGTPDGKPKYSISVKNSTGEDITVADPNATRAAVALMNIHAVVGGAACHWGGPAAFAEIMAATHAIMFATEGRQWHPGVGGAVEWPHDRVQEVAPRMHR